MKTIIYIFLILLVMACKKPTQTIEVATTDYALKKYIVITESRIDTIFASNFTFGNYVGIGRAYIFYNRNEINDKVALIRVEKPDKVIIKQIY